VWQPRKRALNNGFGPTLELRVCICATIGMGYIESSSLKISVSAAMNHIEYKFSHVEKYYVSILRITTRCHYSSDNHKITSCIK